MQIVIGGGLIGMLTARELALAGEQVTLLERGSTGRESSWAGGGILSPLHPWRYPESVSALSRWSQDNYAALCDSLAESTGIDPEWTRNGMLVLSPDEEAAQAWAERWSQRLEMVEPEASRVLEPSLGRPTNAAWLPDVAQVRNPRLVKALRASLDGLGVRIREQSACAGLVVERGRVLGVRTGSGEITAEQVIIAAGAWSAQLLPREVQTPAVTPVRGQMLLFRAEPGAVSRIVLEQDRYVIPRRDGRVLVGSTLERVGFDKSTTAEALVDLHGAALRIIPALSRYPVEHHWAGLRPGSPDGVPYIGAHPEIEGLFLNCGHYRNGVVMGLASARLMTDLMLGRPPILEPAPFAIATPRGE